MSFNDLAKKEAAEKKALKEKDQKANLATKETRSDDGTKAVEPPED